MPVGEDEASGALGGDINVVLRRRYWCGASGVGEGRHERGQHGEGLGMLAKRLQSAVDRQQGNCDGDVGSSWRLCGATLERGRVT